MGTELAKNQVHRARMHGYNSRGAGVCRIMGRAVFVDRALAGEEWDVLILKAASSAVYGKGLRLIGEPSPERRDPACEVFGKCGGCDLMHMSYAGELSFKLARVNDAVSRIAGLNFRIGEIVGASAQKLHHYRNKAIYAVGRDMNLRAVTGFFRERSHGVVPAPNCLIQTELSSRAAAALREFIDKTGVSVYDESTHTGLIRNLYVRCSRRLPQAVACVVAA